MHQSVIRNAKMMELNAKHRFDSLASQSIDDRSSIELIDYEQLNSIDQRVFQYSRHFRSAPDFPVKCDDIVIAIYTAWHKWFRARVLSYNENLKLVKVFAIDYGHELELPKKCVFPLLDMQLAHAEPVCTIKCSSELPPHVARERYSEFLNRDSGNAHSTEKNVENVPEHWTDKMDAAVDRQTSKAAHHKIDEAMDFSTSTPIGIKNGNVFMNSGTVRDKPTSEWVEEKMTELNVDFESVVVKQAKVSDEIPNKLMIRNTGTGSAKSTAGYLSDFVNYPGYATSMLFEDLSLCGATPEEVERMRKIDQDALVKVNDSRPLKELSFTRMETMCIGDSTAGLNLSKCYENFLPHIAEQLKELPKVYPLQQLAWPHLLDGRSAIIIDPSDNLADLVYLPAVCSHVNRPSVQAERTGPLAIIICKTQARSVEIAKRCLSFSSEGCMADCSISVSNENHQYSPQMKFEKCKIFVTSIVYIMRFGLPSSQKCDPVQNIVFDGMDGVNHKLFNDIIHAVGVVPQQIIVTSKLWRPVHHEIYYDKTKDFLIFGAAFDLAIAAKTKFDVMFLDKRKMSSPDSQNYKMRLVLQKIESIDVPKLLIICDSALNVNRIKKELDIIGIKFYIAVRSKNNGTGYYHFNYAGKDVYFCQANMPSIDLTTFSYCCIYKILEKADSLEMQCLAKKFQSIMKPNIDGFHQPDAVMLTISFFCYENSTLHNRSLAEGFSKYQRSMQCPQFWSLIASKNVLSFAHDLCLDFGMYSVPKHAEYCPKRHRFVEDDEPRVCIEQFSIQFRILHFYSPVHYKVEIFAQREGDQMPWMFLNSQCKTVEIYLSYLSPHGRLEPGPRKHDIFQRIFDHMCDPWELSDCYVASVFLKLKDIYFVEDMLPTKPSGNGFTHDIRSFFGDSPEIKDRLKRMLVQFES